MDEAHLPDSGPNSDQVQLYRHGGRLAAARALFPAAPGWIDLSTGVNPIAWAGRRAPPIDLRRLPDPADTRALEKIAAAAFGCAPENIAAVPGVETALRLLPHLTGARHVTIAAPTYGSHAEAWNAAGAEVVNASRADLLPHAGQAIVLVNPNNPDGAFIPARELVVLAEETTRASGWLVVDESFAEVAPEVSVAAHAGGRLIVLRSFGKFYGLPGVRLGFVLADPEILARLRALLGDWPVGADAIAMGRAAYADKSWQRRTLSGLNASAIRLDRHLRRAGFRIIGGTALFRLTSSPDADARFQILAQSGILVRAFDFEPTWLRFGLPPSSGWKRLSTALERCVP